MDKTSGDGIDGSHSKSVFPENHKNVNIGELKSGVRHPILSIGVVNFPGMEYRKRRENTLGETKNGHSMGLTTGKIAPAE